MGYQALLFCPDEKTARTVTQVLNELEFTVESCNEPFAAVKKLMGQHFDAVVVDCDNEQNATLLFKSARNSTSNQTSLAVAVVEGQAGVAKAFRIGANLVLTKPINIEQAKGTVRVARGLLRKSDPAKLGASPVIPTASGVAAPKPAPVKPVSAVRPPVPEAPPIASTPKPVDIPTPKVPAAPAWPVVPAASAAPQDDELLDIDALETPKPAPIPAAVTKPVEILASIPEPKKTSLPVPPSAPESFVAAQKPVTGSGAASAPAPARAVEPPAIEKPQQKIAEPSIAQRPEESAPAASGGIVGSAPSFSFGGGSEEEESKGGSKKILLGVVAAVVIAALAYAGWSHFQGTASPAANPVATSAAPVHDAVKPSSTQPSPVAAAPAPVQKPPVVPAPTANSSAEPADSYQSDVTVRLTPPASKPSAASTPATNKSVEVEEPAETPLVVKGGTAPALHSKSAAVDAPAPSLIGMAAPGTVTPPPNFVPSSNSSIRPMLQTLNISQGVSQGLLIKKVAPSYPANSLRMRVEGTVQLLATISKDGDISHIKVLSGESQLAKAASDAVKQWKYKPYLLNGEPVEIQTQITINFRLPK